MKGSDIRGKEAGRSKRHEHMKTGGEQKRREENRREETKREDDETMCEEGIEIREAR